MTMRDEVGSYSSCEARLNTLSIGMLAQRQRYITGTIITQSIAATSNPQGHIKNDLLQMTISGILFVCHSIFYQALHPQTL